MGRDFQGYDKWSLNRRLIFGALSSFYHVQCSRRQQFQLINTCMMIAKKVLDNIKAPLTYVPHCYVCIHSFSVLSFLPTDSLSYLFPSLHFPFLSFFLPSILFTCFLRQLLPIFSDKLIVFCCFVL